MPLAQVVEARVVAFGSSEKRVQPCEAIAEPADEACDQTSAGHGRFEDPEFGPIVADYAAKVAREFEPFDYGRIEFRFDRKKGEVNFIEINLNCNLWSEKVMAKAAAAAGFSHGQLLETILAESMRRQGVLANVR